MSDLDKSKKSRNKPMGAHGTVTQEEKKLMDLVQSASVTSIMTNDSIELELQFGFFGFVHCVVYLTYK